MADVSFILDGSAPLLRLVRANIVVGNSPNATVETKIQGLREWTTTKQVSDDRWWARLLRLKKTVTEYHSKWEDLPAKVFFF